MLINKSPYLLGVLPLVLSGCNIDPENLDTTYNSQALYQETTYFDPQVKRYQQEQNQLRTLTWERQELKRQLEIERQQRKLAKDLEAERQRRAYDEQRRTFQREQQALANQHEEQRRAFEREQRALAAEQRELRENLERQREEQRRALKRERQALAAEQRELQQNLERQREEQRQRFDAAHDLNAARNSGAAKADLHSELLRKVPRID